MRFFVMLLVLVTSFAASAVEKVDLRVNPLDTPIRAMELQGFRTVGDAARYLLGRIGYNLKIDWPAPVESVFITSLPIRPSAITDKVLPLEELLVSMVTDKYILVVDHYGKAVSFAPREEKNFVPKRAIEQVFNGQYIVPDIRMERLNDN